MPNFRITLVSYTDAVVEAPDLDTVHKWLIHRSGEALFRTDNTAWSPHLIEDNDDAIGEPAIAMVKADGTCVLLALDERESITSE
jgi:hypothetical protein